MYRTPGWKVKNHDFVFKNPKKLDLFDFKSLSSKILRQKNGNRESNYLFRFISYIYILYMFVLRSESVVMNSRLAILYTAALLRTGSSGEWQTSGKQAHSTPRPGSTPLTQVTLSLGCMIIISIKKVFDFNQ